MKLKYRHFVCTVLVTAGFLASPVWAMYKTPFGSYGAKSVAHWRYTHKIEDEDTRNPRGISTGYTVCDGSGGQITQPVKYLIVDNLAPIAKNHLLVRKDERKELAQVAHDTATLCAFIRHKKPKSVQLPFVHNDAKPILEACGEVGVENLTIFNQILDSSEWKKVAANGNLQHLHVQTYNKNPGDPLKHLEDSKIFTNLKRFSYRGEIPNERTRDTIKKLQAQTGQLVNQAVGFVAGLNLNQNNAVDQDSEDEGIGEESLNQARGFDE